MIEEFYSFSSLKLNSHETKLLKIGHHIQDDIVTPFEIVDKIKILGIVFENGKRSIDIDENWTGRIEKLTRIVQLWSKRDLSIMGKIVIVKMFFGESTNLCYAINRPSRKSSYRCQYTVLQVYMAEEIFK